MELTIRHFIPGRVRVHVPSLCRRRPLAEASLAWLRSRPGIKSARVNYDCACLVVEYDVAQEALLRALIGRLRLMSTGDLHALVAPEEPAGNLRRRCPSRCDPVTAAARAAGSAHTVGCARFQRQPHCHSHQPAVDALECLS